MTEKKMTWGELVATLPEGVAARVESTQCIIVINEGRSAVESRLGLSLRNLVRGVVERIYVPGDWNAVRAFPGGLLGFTQAVDRRDDWATCLLSKEIPHPITGG
jgi:hypothetical protein